jgi:hypothetical protein
MKSVLVVLVILASVIVEPAQKQQAQTKARKNQETTQRNPVPSTPAAQQETINNYYQPQPKTWYWHDAIAPPTWSNWGLVLVGIGATVAALLTLRGINLQAKAMINSERAWLVVEIGQLPEIVPQPNSVQILWLAPHIRNYGKSTARIERVSIRLHQIPSANSLPPEPEYSVAANVNFVLPPTVWARPWQLSIPTSDFYAIQQGTSTVYFYGFVDYRDLAKDQRQTRFCFRYDFQSGFSPEPSGFYPVLNVPEAYTRCT